MNFKRFKDGLLGLKEIMMKIENTKDECELKIWELTKTARKKLKEFRIEKKEELGRKLLRVRIRSFEDLSKQEIEKINKK